MTASRPDPRPGFRAWAGSGGLPPHVAAAARDLLVELDAPDQVADPGTDPVKRLLVLEGEDNRRFWREMETVHGDVRMKLEAGQPFEAIPEVRLLRALGFRPEEWTFRRLVETPEGGRG